LLAVFQYRFLKTATITSRDLAVQAFFRVRRHQEFVNVQMEINVLGTLKEHKQQIVPVLIQAMDILHLTHLTTVLLNSQQIIAATKALVMRMVWLDHVFALMDKALAYGVAQTVWVAHALDHLSLWQVIAT